MALYSLLDIYPLDMTDCTDVAALGSRCNKICLSNIAWQIEPSYILSLSFLKVIKNEILQDLVVTQRQAAIALLQCWACSNMNLLYCM